MNNGVTINRPFAMDIWLFRSPDGISLEILQEGEAPSSGTMEAMENSGTWCSIIKFYFIGFIWISC